MKYGFLFAVAAALLSVYAMLHGGLRLVLLWPALTCLLVSGSYFRLTPRLFGKRPEGTLAPWSTLLLFPYVGSALVAWHGMRLINGEAPFHDLLPSVRIGRRLLAGELPADVEMVVDLTCEFAEPAAARAVRQYVSFPILDGAPAPHAELLALVQQLARIEAPMYVHCAIGRGRTGMVAAALLLARGEAATAEAALRMVCERRASVRLTRAQFAAVEQVAEALGPTRPTRAVAADSGDSRTTP